MKYTKSIQKANIQIHIQELNFNVKVSNGLLKRHFLAAFCELKAMEIMIVFKHNEKPILKPLPNRGHFILANFLLSENAES
jgi:hypothetical protein